MKRIEFIAPVEAMRGNLGETQRDIVYPTHDNSAYDGPEGERNTARNYKPIIVGAKRANGRAYFSVRTKTTNHLTPLVKKSMATMGATCAIYSAMRKDSAIAAKMDEVFAFMLPSLPASATPRSYFMERINLALKDKEPVIDLSAGQISLTVDNPWQFRYEQSDPMPNITIRRDILVKFWDELSNGYTFYVNGNRGISFDEDALYIVEDHDTYFNVLGLDYDEDYDRMKIGGVFVYSIVDGQNVYVSGSDKFTPNGEYYA